MSTATNIYDKIRDIIPSLTGFSDKTEIPYPYNLEEENVNFLRSGWGVLIGSSTPQTPTDNTTYTLISEYEIVLTERVATTSSNKQPLIDITKNIMNDISTLNDTFTETPFSTSTTFSSTDKIEYVDVISIAGIENVAAGKFNHIKTSITFGITHWK